MTCETCSDMTMAVEAMGEELIRLKRSNKILRNVNSTLRREVTALKEGKDQLFLELCATKPSAEIAMGELWGSGEFDCGPQDYEFIVNRCIEAVREYNASRTNPD